MSARHGRTSQPSHHFRRQAVCAFVEIGVCRPPPAQRKPTEPQLVARSKTWLLKASRGTSDTTIKLYARDADRLMVALRNDPAGWEPAATRSFFLDRASHCRNGTVEKLTRACVRGKSDSEHW
jgi:hypothetical protein